MKKNLLKIYESFFDDLDKLNQDKVNDEFGEVNGKVYDEYSYILSPDKNPEFFEGLCKMCGRYYPDLPSNKNGFSQEDLNKIIKTYDNYNEFSYFENVTSLDELQYFHNLKGINTFCFGNCQNLKSIIFPENLLYIFKDAFHWCTYLEKVIFPKSLKEIGQYSFSKCSSLKEIIFPKNISNIEYNSFQDCTSLEKIIIPERFKDNMKYIFYEVNLTKVDITYI